MYLFQDDYGNDNVFAVYGTSNLLYQKIQNDTDYFNENFYTVQIGNDSIIGIDGFMQAIRVNNVLSAPQTIHYSHRLVARRSFYDLVDFSLTNFHNKLLIVSGGREKNYDYDSYGESEWYSNTYALEVDSGMWKNQDKLPSLNTPRSNHSSCVLGNSIYVIAG